MSVHTPFIAGHKLRKYASDVRYKLSIDAASRPLFGRLASPNKCVRRACCFVSGLARSGGVVLTLLVVAKACQKKLQSLLGVNRAIKKLTPLKWVCVNAVNNAFN